jgi:hypothetical protein
MIMSIRIACLAVALTAAAVVPAVANEAGYIEPVPQFGSVVRNAPTAAQSRSFISSMPLMMAMSQSCAKPMARHDHGAERNAMRAPIADAMPCSGSESGAAKTANRPVHDHAKFHKHQ